MKKSTSVQILIFLSVAAIFLSQGLWLRNSYIANKNLIRKKIHEILIHSINLEASLRLQDCILEGEKEEVQDIDLSLEEIDKLHSPIDISLQEILVQNSCFISLSKLHKICKTEMKEEGIEGIFIVQKINLNNNSILESSSYSHDYSEASFITRTVPIRLEHTEGIRLFLLRPHWTIFKQMLLLLILSILLMGFVFFALYRQLHLFLQEKKLRELQKDHTEAMVHTMKTPLQSITQVHEFIEKGSFDNDTKKRNHFIQLAGKQIKGLQVLVNRILSISQWETSTLTLHKTKVDIKMLVFLLCEQIKETSTKEVTIISNFNLQQESFFLDKEAIEDVIQNLLENAVKYSKESVIIESEIFTKGNSLFIKIKDNGLGISTRAQKKIFKKFERGDAPFRQGAKGFGLGLAFSKGIVEAHGGNITVKSQEGKGSEFCIQLPIKHES